MQKDKQPEMERYEYQAVSLEISAWTGRAKMDYLKVLNEYGAEGWRFVQFAPTIAKPRKAGKGIELVFERKITSSITSKERSSIL